MSFFISQNNSPPVLPLIQVSPVNSALPACTRALHTYASSLAPVTALILMVSIPLEIVLIITATLLRVFQPGKEWLALPMRIAVYSIASAFVAPALIHIFHRSRSLRPSSLRAAVRFALPLWGRSFIYRLQAVAYIFAGTIAFVVPGVFLILFALLVDPVVAFEPAESKVFRRSRLLGKGLRLQFAAALTLIVILQLTGSFALLSGLSRVAPAQPGPIIAAVLESFIHILQQVLGALAVALSFELYLAARANPPSGRASAQGTLGTRFRSALLPKLGSSAQHGFSLIETVVAVLVLFVAVVIGMQFLMVRAGSIALSERRSQAEEGTEGALNALAARSSTNLANATPSFNLLADGAIQITRPCDDLSCDALYPTNTSLALRSSLAGGTPISAVTGTPLFFRRWRFDQIDVQKRLYRITVVVVTDEAATQPLAIRSVEAVLNSQ